MADRRESVSLAVAVKAHYKGVASGQTSAEVAAGINMSQKSFDVKISQARKRLRVSTSIFVDPSDSEKTINGVDLMTRLKLDPKAIDKAVKAGTQTVVTVGTIIPSLKSSGQRSTRGNSALVDLVAALTGTEDTAESTDTADEDSSTESD